MSPAPRSHPAVGGSIVVSLVIIVVMAGWFAFDWGGARATQVADDVILFVAPMLAAVCCAFASARAVSRPSRIGWALLGGAAAAWGLGELAWGTYEVVLGVDVPYPSLADIGYLLAIPLAAAGLLVLSSRTSVRAARIRSLMDAFIIAGAVFSISWAIVLGPIFRESGEGSIERAIDLAYPLGDVVIASLAIQLISRVPRAERRPVVLAAVAMCAMAVADSGYLYLTAASAYASGNLIDVGWLAGYLLLAVAAVDRATSPVPVAEPKSDRATLSSALVPYVPFGIALVVLGVRVVPGDPDPFLIWLGIMLVGLLVSRQLLHIVDHLRSLRQLAAANDELARLQEFRTQLLNNVSHDLATPLTPVLLQLHILKGSRLGESDRKSLDVIGRNVEQLQRLVLDVKDVARIQGHGLKVDRKPIDVAALVRSAVESFRDVAGASGVDLDANVVDKPLPAEGDEGRITQVMFNLITNALKFTPAGGRILVEARAEAGSALVSVKDSGRGLTDAEQARLFQPFVQVHERSEVKERGTGLGLYICRGIVEEHGGHIGVASEGRGFGSTFSFDVPLQARALVAPLAART